MKISTILKRAAQYRRMERGACRAIDWAKGENKTSWDESPAHVYFNAMFRPDPLELDLASRLNRTIRPAAYYFLYEDGYALSDVVGQVEANKRRRTALLLAAEIAESEGL